MDAIRFLMIPLFCSILFSGAVNLWRGPINENQVLCLLLHYFSFDSFYLRHTINTIKDYSLAKYLVSSKPYTTLSLTPTIKSLSSYRNMSSIEKVNSVQHSSDQDDLGNVINTNAGDSKKNRSSSFTSQTSLLSSYCHMNTFEKGNDANDSDISEQEDLCNIANTNAAVSFAEYLDSSEKKISSICTSQESLLLISRHMNTFKKGNDANDSDISEQENLCNFTNTNSAVSFAENSDYSEKNMSSSCAPKTSLLSSHRHINTSKKGNSAND